MTRVFDQHFAQVPFTWAPLNMKLTAKHPWFYLHLGFNYYLQWNLLPDYDEQTVWQIGRWYITRPETVEEREDREMSEEEALAIEADQARYIDWSY